LLQLEIPTENQAGHSCFN